MVNRSGHLPVEPNGATRLEAGSVESVFEKRTSLGPSMHESIRTRQIGQFTSQLPSFVARCTWPVAKLRAERQSCLRALLRTAKTYSPWHAKRLARIDPDTFTEDQLTTLPTMTKSDLMANFDEIITNRSLSLKLVEAHLRQLNSDTYLLGSFHVVTTGGSSGQRGVFVYDWNGWIKMGLSSARVLSLMGIEPGRNESCVFIGAGEAAHGSAAFAQSFAPWLQHVFSPFVGLSVTQPISEIIDRLNEAQPKRVFGFPSVLRQLCFAAEEGSLRIAPKSIMVGAEPLSPETRTRIVRTFNARLYNFYGCSEASCVGFSCPSGPGLHLSDDLIIVEPVTAVGFPVPAGVASARVLLTNLFNHLMPLIRYDLDDSVVPMESVGPCLCGSSFEKIRDVRGRTDDSFCYPNGIFVHPVAFSALSHEPTILEFQVRQSERGAHILIHAVRSFDHQAMRDKIRDALERLGLPRAEISMEFVEKVPRSPAGKLRQFVRLPHLTPGQSPGSQEVRPKQRAD